MSGIPKAGTIGRVRNVQYVTGVMAGFDAEADVLEPTDDQDVVQWSRIQLPELFAGHIHNGYVTLNVRRGIKLDAFYAMLAEKVGMPELDKSHFVTLVLPAMMPGQARVANVVAKCYSPMFRGCIQVQLINPVKSA